MHELAITKEIVELILEECKRRKIKSVKNIKIEIGNMTTYKKNPILHYFEIIKKENQVTKNANLKVKEIKGEDLIIKSFEENS